MYKTGLGLNVSESCGAAHRGLVGVCRGLVPQVCGLQEALHCAHAEPVHPLVQPEPHNVLFIDKHSH